MIIVRRCVSFLSKITFHVASGMQCAPMLGILLPDGQRRAQGRCIRSGNFRKGEVAPKSRLATSVGNVAVAPLWPFQTCITHE